MRILDLHNSRCSGPQLHTWPLGRRGRCSGLVRCCRRALLRRRCRALLRCGLGALRRRRHPLRRRPRARWRRDVAFEGPPVGRRAPVLVLVLIARLHDACVARRRAPAGRVHVHLGGVWDLGVGAAWGQGW
jgi:hypothetical protein